MGRSIKDMIVDQSSSWSGTGMWDLMLVPDQPRDLESVRAAVLADPTISAEVAPTVRLAVTSWPGTLPLLWYLDGVGTLGMLMRTADWHAPSAAIVLSLPTRIASVCVSPAFAAAHELEPSSRVAKLFFTGAVSLARRINAVVPLRQASVLFEGGAHALGSRSGVVIDAIAARALGWTAAETHDTECLIPW